MTTPARNQLLLDLLRADLDFRLFQILEWLLSNIHFQKDFALFRGGSGLSSQPPKIGRQEPLKFLTVLCFKWSNDYSDHTCEGASP